MNEKRMFAAKIELDENVAKQYSEDNELGDFAPGDYLEREFGWLWESGLSLSHWLITDHDDESEWARYINYLINWAFEHSSEENVGSSPARFDEWCDNEEGDYDE